MIQFPCSGCGRCLRTSDDQAGKRTRCPECRTVQRIPASATSEAATLAVPPQTPASETATLGPQSSASQSGTTKGPPLVPGYELLAELGRGGMGVIYKARQLRLKRLVALKMILSGDHAGAEALARFRAEAEAVARLNHPNIVQIYEVGEHQGRPFLALELVEGESLAQKLASKPLPFRAAARLIQQLALAVQFAHDRGVIHRDLKPANVLLTSDDGVPDGMDGTDGKDKGHPSHSLLPKIADFGLAKQLDTMSSAAPTGPRTQSGAVLGTPAYMAPEQAAGKTALVGPAVDVYALGAILYECLTGQPPFAAESVIELLMKVAKDEPVSPRKLQRDCPHDLATICLKCLEKDPKKRFASAGELAGELDRYLNDQPLVCRPPGRRERLGRLVRRHRNLAYLLAGATIAVCFSLVVLALWFPRQKGAGATAMTSPEQKTEDEAELVELPPDLQLVPRNAFQFTTIRLADVLARKDALALYERLNLNQVFGAPQLLREIWGGSAFSAGIKPEDVERFTIMLKGSTSPPLCLFALARPVDVERLRQAFHKQLQSAKPIKAARGKAPPKNSKREMEPIQVQGKIVYRPTMPLPTVPAFCAYTDRVLILGATDEIISVVERSAFTPDRGPLRRSLELAAGSHALVTGVHVPPSMFQMLIASQNRRDKEQQDILGTMQAGTLVVDLGPASEQGLLSGLAGGLRLAFPDAATAAKAQVLLAALWHTSLRQINTPGALPGGLGSREADLMSELVLPALRAAEWQQKGSSVSIEVQLNWTDSDLVRLQAAQAESATRARTGDNLRTIALAMYKYQSVHGRFPPAAVHGKNGEPLYSWRVELLPHLGQQALYNQFHRDEPWDSPDNKKLLERMPDIYAAPWLKKGPQTETYFQVFVGPRAAFEGKTGLSPTVFTDGTSNTFLIVEAAEAVPWTAPRDLPYEPGKPLPKLGGHFKGVFYAAFADGSARPFHLPVSPAALHAYITRNNGDNPFAPVRRP